MRPERPDRPHPLSQTRLRRGRCGEAAQDETNAASARNGGRGERSHAWQHAYCDSRPSARESLPEQPAPSTDRPVHRAEDVLGDFESEPALAFCQRIPGELAPAPCGQVACCRPCPNHDLIGSRTSSTVVAFPSPSRAVRSTSSRSTRDFARAAWPRSDQRSKERRRPSLPTGEPTPHRTAASLRLWSQVCGRAATLRRRLLEGKARRHLAIRSCRSGSLGAWRAEAIALSTPIESTHAPHLLFRRGVAMAPLGAFSRSCGDTRAISLPFVIMTHREAWPPLAPA
jgi:hypothetical protein